jgi:hypothetical protein
MKIYKSELLNNKLQPCLTDAVFQENQFDEPSRIVDSAVETFNSAYTDAAKALSIATEATPIGEGVGKETKIIHEVALSWNGKAWIGSGQHFEIEISPECDIHDVSVWLKNFKPIREKVLARRFEYQNTLKFLIGAEANKKHNKCVAFALGNTIGFPISEKGHVVAVKTSQASQTTPDLKPVEIHHILLHEVGHTLKQNFQEKKDMINIELARNGAMSWSKLENLNTQISPHYLAQQQQAILLKFGEIHIKTVLEPKQPTTTNDLKWITTVGSEIFAEICRVYYLEAVLEENLKPPTKTGCQPIDELIETMCEQAKLTLQKSPKEIPRDGMDTNPLGNL